jgi:hypothetical protein
VLKGRGASGLIGLPVTSFAAWTREKGAWRRVRIQIDEVNHRGDYVLEGGLPFTRDSDDGWFDDNDEVVVDGGDLGEDFEERSAPTGVPDAARLAWKVTLCRGNDVLGHLWVASLLAGVAVKDPLPTAPPAVRFDQAAEGAVVETSRYRYRFAKEHPALLGDVELKRADGTAAPALRDARFLMPLVTPFWMPDVTLGDHDFTSTIESWQVGPLRTIVAVGVKYQAFLSLFKLHLFSELVFYRNRFVVPTEIEFVFDPSKYLSPGSGIAYGLRFPEGRPWLLSTNLAELPSAVPNPPASQGGIDAGSGAESRALEDDVPFVVRGSRAGDGAFRVEVRVDPRARAAVPPPFLIDAEAFKNREKRAAWPWLAGLGEATGDLGIYLDFAGIKPGSYDFGLDLLVSELADQDFADYGPVDATWRSLPLRTTR